MGVVDLPLALELGCLHSAVYFLVWSVEDDVFVLTEEEWLLREVGS